MRAVLMAGGQTRLRPLTCDLQTDGTHLNRPIAEHIINLLKRHQITEVCYPHYLPDVFATTFKMVAILAYK